MKMNRRLYQPLDPSPVGKGEDNIIHVTLVGCSGNGKEASSCVSQEHGLTTSLEGHTTVPPPLHLLHS